MRAQLKFAKLHLNKQKVFWNNVLQTDDTKLEVIGQGWIGTKISALVLEWRQMKGASFPAPGPEARAGIEVVVSASIYQSILESMIGPSV